MWQHHAHCFCRGLRAVQNSRFPGLGAGLVVAIDILALHFDDVLLGSAGISRSASPQG